MVKNNFQLNHWPQNKICISLLPFVSSLHSYKMSGQSSRTEHLLEEDLGSTKSKSAAALCWPECFITNLLVDPLNDYVHVFVLVLSRGVRI